MNKFGGTGGFDAAQDSSRHKFTRSIQEGKEVFASSCDIQKTSILSSRHQKEHLGQMSGRKSTAMAKEHFVHNTSDASFHDLSADKNNLKFQKTLLSILSKFGEQYTLQQGLEEMRVLISSDITDNDKMNMFLQSLTNFSQYDQNLQRQEQIKVFGIAAEIFEEALVQFVPKILKQLQTCIKDDHNGKLNLAIQETYGQMVYYLADKANDIYENQFIRGFIFKLLEKGSNKQISTAAIMCLSKAVTQCPDEVLAQNLDIIMVQIIKYFKQKTFVSKQELLEALIQIIFHIQHQIQDYYSKLIPILLEMLQTKDIKLNGMKRVAIDAIYSLSVHCQEKIMKHKQQIMKLLDICRTDKAKPVRDAAMETLKMMKEIQNQHVDDTINTSNNQRIILNELEDNRKDIGYDLSFDQSDQGYREHNMDSEVDELSMIMEPDEAEKKRQQQSFTEEEKYQEVTNSEMENTDCLSSRNEDLMMSARRQKFTQKNMAQLDRDRRKKLNTAAAVVPKKKAKDDSLYIQMEENTKNFNDIEEKIDRIAQTTRGREFSPRNTPNDVLLANLKKQKQIEFESNKKADYQNQFSPNGNRESQFSPPRSMPIDMTPEKKEQISTMKKQIGNKFKSLFKQQMEQQADDFATPQQEESIKQPSQQEISILSQELARPTSPDFAQTTKISGGDRKHKSIFNQKMNEAFKKGSQKDEILVNDEVEVFVEKRESLKEFLLAEKRSSQADMPEAPTINRTPTVKVLLSPKSKPLSPNTSNRILSPKSRIPILSPRKEGVLSPKRENIVSPNRENVLSPKSRIPVLSSQREKFLSPHRELSQQILSPKRDKLHHKTPTVEVIAQSEQVTQNDPTIEIYEPKQPRPINLVNTDESRNRSRSMMRGLDSLDNSQISQLQSIPVLQSSKVRLSPRKSQSPVIHYQKEQDTKLLIEQMKQIQKTQTQIMSQMSQFQQMFQHLNLRISQVEMNCLKNKMTSPRSDENLQKLLQINKLKQELEMGLNQINPQSNYNQLMMMQQLQLQQQNALSQNSFIQGDQLIQKKIQSINEREATPQFMGVNMLFKDQM